MDDTRIGNSMRAMCRNSTALRILVLQTLVACVGFGMISCAGDESNTPSPHYILCAGIRPGGWIAVFDCDSDSLVDSLGYPGMLTPMVYGSDAGDFLAAAESGRPTRIWDLRTRMQVKELLGPEQVLFVTGQQLLIATRVNFTNFYELPSLELAPLWMSHFRTQSSFHPPSIY